MLENKCRTCGRDLDSGFNCPVCANKTMTTPTKEQIFKIICAMTDKNMYWDSIDCEDDYEVIGFIITEWEKIRGK